MKKWEVALSKFLEDWRDRPEVLGAVLCGSRATGMANDLSDIDCQIVLKNDTLWRDRGITCINGFTIEYYAVPKNNFKIYSDQEISEDQIKVDARVFSTSRVIFDKDGSVADLVMDAKNWFEKEFPIWPDEDKALFQKHLWDNYDHLREYNRYPSPMFKIIYALLLADILEFYARVTRTEKLPIERAHRLLSDDHYREKYAFPKITDSKFVSLLLATIENQAFTEMDLLYKYTQEIGGGFDPNSWYMRRKALEPSEKHNLGTTVPKHLTSTD